MSILTRLRDLLSLPKKHKYHNIPPDLAEHLYRDIGLSKDDIELLRFQWPSQGPHGPKL